MLIEDIEGGEDREAAVTAFAEGIRKPPDRYWVPADSLPPLLDTLRKVLHSPITADDAFVLRSVAFKREKMEVALRWWTERPDLNWAEFQALLLCEEQEEELESRLADYRQWKAGPQRVSLLGGRVQMYEILPEGSPEGSLTLAEFLLQPQSEADRAYEEIIGHRNPPIAWTVVDALLKYARARPCQVCGASAAELTWSHVHYNDMFDLSGVDWMAWLTICERCELVIDRFDESFAIA